MPGPCIQIDTSFKSARGNVLAAEVMREGSESIIICHIYELPRLLLLTQSLNEVSK